MASPGKLTLSVEGIELQEIGYLVKRPGKPFHVLANIRATFLSAAVLETELKRRYGGEWEIVTVWVQKSR